MDRNQREARITQLEKSLMKSETRKKELEVDGNRIRQQLTVARQMHASVNKEVNKVRSLIHELTPCVTSIVK